MDLENNIRCGETSTLQFKQELSSPRQMASEMVAFANSKGGRILFGIKDKTGEILGLRYEDVQRISAELGNIATELCRPVIYLTTEVVEIQGKTVLIANVREGINKPYKDLSGVIWVKQAADKRKLVENSEILGLFQQSQMYLPEESGLIGTSYADLEVAYINDFFQKTYGKPKENFGKPVDAILKSIGVLTQTSEVSKAGMLFFGRNPQLFLKTFKVKAVAYYGNSIGESEYQDSRDIEGTIPNMYRDAMSFLKANLKHEQAGQSFNSVGKTKVPQIVLEELLQNALVHIDLLEPTYIRLLVFSDRIEIINPGSLFGGLTIDEIKLGVSKLRNPLIASFCSKLMVYRGLGSGIIRALGEGVKIDFENNTTINEFKSVIWFSDRNSVSNDRNSVSNEGNSVSKKSQMILDFCVKPKLLIEIADYMGAKDRYWFKTHHIDPLLGNGLSMTEPNSPRSPTQKYVTTQQNVHMEEKQ